MSPSLRLAPVSPPYRRLVMLALSVLFAIFLFLSTTAWSSPSDLALARHPWHTSTQLDAPGAPDPPPARDKAANPALSPAISDPGGARGLSRVLGVMSRIYVVSLPHRADRRVQMDQLERALGLNWTYVDAIDADDPLIANVMDQVRTLRNNVVLSAVPSLDELSPPAAPIKPTFSWPEDIDSQASSDALLEPAGSDIWTLPALFGPLEPHFPGETLDRFSPSTRLRDPTRRPPHPPPDLACTADNDLLAPLAPEHPAHMLLTPARIACWHSHLQVIRAIANGNDDGPALVLEDDIDMEWDTQARLAALWSALPAAWDIVYLGDRSSHPRSHPRSSRIHAHRGGQQDTAGRTKRSSPPSAGAPPPPCTPPPRPSARTRTRSRAAARGARCSTCGTRRSPTRARSTRRSRGSCAAAGCARSASCRRSSSSARTRAATSCPAAGASGGRGWTTGSWTR